MDGPTDAQIIASVADALPVGIWIARAPGGEFVYANRVFQVIMGIGARDDVARDEYAAPYAIHGRDGALYPEHRMPFVRALEARETVMVDDIVIHRLDGGRVNVRAYARPIFESGTITHVVIAFFDITREVVAERAREESETRMRQAQRMESIGNLAGGIAHDFNNLLGAIRSVASVLALSETDPARLDDFAAIDTATSSAVALTRALLGFAGHGKNLSEPLSVNDVVGSVCDIVSHALDARIELATDLEASRFVAGDRSQIEQVVMNLAINARDAMEGSGKLTIRTFERGDHVVLEVEDDGPGVPAEIRHRVFEPYVTTKTRTGAGTSGLGLATAYGIVETHGGTLDVRDAPGGGAIFCVALPALAAPTAPRLRAPGSEIVRGSGLVLVVDDEPALRRAAQRVLETVGYDVITAEDGVEGVALFAERREEIAAVVLDMSMPNLDGRGAFLAMQKIDPNVCVLLMTGYALNDQAQAIVDLGARGFLAKPFGVAELSAAVAAALESSAR